MAAPAAAAAPVAGVYVAGAALIAGAAWLMTPAGRRASETLGGAIYEGGAAAAKDVRDVASAAMDMMTGADDEAVPVSVPTTTTNDTTRRCDGPHRGRLQVQGYDPRVDPFDFTSDQGPSWGWAMPCYPPLRAVGLAQLSTNLLVQTQNIRHESAGLRGAAFAKMSRHIANAPPIGFVARHVAGWNHLGRRAFGSGRNVPRVDLEVTRGRAFGDR